MQSPPLELVLDVVHLASRNLYRNVGEADGDTISEIIRAAKDRIPYGDHVLAAILAGSAYGFWRHICRPKWATA